MKKLFFILTLFCSTAVLAQKKTVPVKKPVAPVRILKNVVDSASYAIGVSVANFYKQQGMKQLNATLVSKAISDILGGKKALLDDNQANTVMMRYINQASEAKALPNITAGKKFLAQNKSKAGVKTTASGLQYQVMVAGSGQKPSASDSVTCHYAGTLLDGTEFDNSYKRGQPITFAVGGVIRGWTEALQLMPVGSKYKLFIPQELAYGTNETGSIPAGSVLVFEVELLDIPNKK
ncbi:MAG: FKBP-type peptidyl-prolyl cis-trans isomerase [Chitinophagaceae bacterium]